MLAIVALSTPLVAAAPVQKVDGAIAMPANDPNRVARPVEESVYYANIVPGWCSNWNMLHHTVHRGLNHRSRDDCYGECIANPDCNQAVFESVGPWGTQCWLGSGVMDMTSHQNAVANNPGIAGQNRSCATTNCIDECFNPRGWNGNHAGAWQLRDPTPTTNNEFCQDAHSQWNCQITNSNPGSTEAIGGSDEAACLSWCADWNFCSFDYGTWAGNRCCARMSTCTQTTVAADRAYRVYASTTPVAVP